MPESPETRSVGPVTLSATAGMTVAGALTTILVWGLALAGVDVPGPVAAALTVLLAAVGTLIGGWLVRPGNGTRRLDS